MSERPLLYLDVDGVLNCLAWAGRDYDDLKRPIGGFTCVVPPGTRDRVRRLLDAYDPVWATAWLGGAHSAWRDELGLDELPWDYIRYAEFKLPEIIRHAGDRRWAWVDDTAFWELKRLGWTEDHVEGLIVRVDDRYGLTDDLVEQLLEFANE